MYSWFKINVSIELESKQIMLLYPIPGAFKNYMDQKREKGCEMLMLLEIGSISLNSLTRGEKGGQKNKNLVHVTCGRP